MDVVVLTLPHRTDRLRAFRERHGELGRTQYGAAGAREWDGCWASHRDIWRGAHGDTLVLEDDAVLHEDWAEALAAVRLPSEWQLLYLGGQHAVAPEPVGPGLVRAVQVWRTHAYVLRAGAAPALLAATDAGGDHLDDLLGRATLAGQLRAYALTPWVAGQAAGYSDITRRPEPERWWHGPAA